MSIESDQPDSTVFRLCYFSTLSYPMTEAEFAAIGVAGRHNNARLNITGILLHCAGTFFQTLEGSEENVRKLYEMIAGDPRHTNVVLIGSQRDAQRRYSGVAMNCCDVRRDALPEGFIFDALNRDQDRAFGEVSELMDKLYNDRLKGSDVSANTIIAA